MTPVRTWRSIEWGSQPHSNVSLANRFFRMVPMTKSLEAVFCPIPIPSIEWHPTTHVVHIRLKPQILKHSRSVLGGFFCLVLSLSWLACHDRVSGLKAAWVNKRQKNIWKNPTPKVRNTRPFQLYRMSCPTLELLHLTKPTYLYYGTPARFKQSKLSLYRMVVHDTHITNNLC